MISSSGLGVPELLLIVGIVIVTFLVVVLPACRICAKAGYPAWLGVLAILPVAIVVPLLFLAFSRWPIEKQVEALQQGRV